MYFTISKFSSICSSFFKKFKNSFAFQKTTIFYESLICDRSLQVLSFFSMFFSLSFSSTFAKLLAISLFCYSYSLRIAYGKSWRTFSPNLFFKFLIKFTNWIFTCGLRVWPEKWILMKSINSLRAIELWSPFRYRRESMTRIMSAISSLLTLMFFMLTTSKMSFRKALVWISLFLDPKNHSTEIVTSSIDFWLIISR